VCVACGAKFKAEAQVEEPAVNSCGLEIEEKVAGNWVKEV